MINIKPILPKYIKALIWLLPTATLAHDQHSNTKDLFSDITHLLTEPDHLLIISVAGLFVLYRITKRYLKRETNYRKVMKNV